MSGNVASILATFFRVAKLGVLGAILCTIFQVFVGTLMAFAYLVVSDLLAPPSLRAARAEMVDAAAMTLLFPALVFFPTAPLLGAVAAWLVRRYSTNKWIVIAGLGICQTLAIMSGKGEFGGSYWVVTVMAVVIDIPITIGLALSALSSIWLIYSKPTEVVPNAERVGH